MGTEARLAALTAAVLATACGDPLVVVGDSPGIMRVVAGIPDSAGHQLGERATQSLLNAPFGVIAAELGVVYIADHSNSRILEVTSAGSVQAVTAASGGTEPALQGPAGLAIDSDGRLLIADQAGHRVLLLDLTSGVMTAIAGTGTRGADVDTVDAILASLDSPTGVALAADGTIYFSEASAHRIRRLDPGGLLTTYAGTGSPGASGDGGQAVSARLRNPAGLAIADGVMYLADSGNHRIRAIDLNTEVITTIAGAGADGFGGDGGPAIDALLSQPLAVSIVSGSAFLYVADSGNHRIRAVDLRTQNISTFAGTGETNFNGDLLAAGESTLSDPHGLSLAPSGFLYVSDSGHHIVRRVATAFVAVP